MTVTNLPISHSSLTRIRCRVVPDTINLAPIARRLYTASLHFGEFNNNSTVDVETKWPTDNAACWPDVNRKPMSILGPHINFLFQNNSIIMNVQHNLATESWLLNHVTSSCIDKPARITIHQTKCQHTCILLSVKRVRTVHADVLRFISCERGWKGMDSLPVSQ
jgi:hypothetical protein